MMTLVSGRKELKIVQTPNLIYLGNAPAADALLERMAER
jgi:hypothetical protein